MGCHLPAAVDERVHRAELVEDRRGVDDGDEVVEARDVVEARAGGRVLEGEGLGDGEGLLGVLTSQDVSTQSRAVDDRSIA